MRSFKIEIAVICACGIETASARRADRHTIQILIDCELVPARAAQDRSLGEFADGPDLGLVTGDGCVTFKARKPTAAAFESYGDNIEFAVVMSASGLRIDILTKYLLAVNCPHDLVCYINPAPE